MFYPNKHRTFAISIEQKDMKKKNFVSKAAMLLTKRGTFKQINEQTFELLTEGHRIYPRKWKNNYRRLKDGMPRLKENLNALGVEYATGNSAPRGGVEGDYIELTPRGLRQTRVFRKAVLETMEIIKRRYEELGHTFIGPDEKRYIRSLAFRTQVVSDIEIWQMAIVAICTFKNGETADLI